MKDASVETKSSAFSIILWVMAFGIGYSIIRYHIAGPVPWKDLSFFILNKGICLSAFILLVMNFALGPMKNLGLSVSDGWLNARMAIGMTGFLLVLIHVLMSLMLFSPTIYGKFFDANATMTLNAGLSMFAGIVALSVIKRTKRFHKPGKLHCITHPSPFKTFARHLQMAALCHVRNIQDCSGKCTGDVYHCVSRSTKLPLGSNG